MWLYSTLIGGFVPSQGSLGQEKLRSDSQLHVEPCIRLQDVFEMGSRPKPISQVESEKEMSHKPQFIHEADFSGSKRRYGFLMDLYGHVDHHAKNHSKKLNST
jgi:hypothetical protein